MCIALFSFLVTRLNRVDQEHRRLTLLTRRSIEPSEEFFFEPL